MIYSLNCLVFIIVIGGAVYEHLNVVPAWSAAPPVSLSMFQGEYGLNPELFWMLIHPVNLLLFVLNLVLHWRTGRRNNLLIVFGTYVLILAVTAIYFIPELVGIMTTPFSETVDPSLTARASLWKALSLVRLSVLVVLSMILLTGLTKSKARVARRVLAKPIPVNSLVTNPSWE